MYDDPNQQYQIIKEKKMSKASVTRNWSMFGYSGKDNG